jgi:hypothetical protein
MRKLYCPKFDESTDFKSGQLYSICISKIRKKSIRKTMKGIVCDIKNAEDAYAVNASNNALFQVCKDFKNDQLPSIDCNIKKQLIKTYSDRMVKQDSPGRVFYNRIMLVSPNQICPLCGTGVVNSLDHHLPKTHFSVYSVTPFNLVPVCAWCQYEKGTYSPEKEGDQLLHPYFDDFDCEVWLASMVVEGEPAVFKFFTAPPNNWSEVKKDRVARHLNELKLAKLFTSLAGQRLSSIRLRLNKLINAGSSDSVREYFIEELESLEQVHKNSWESAMYRAAINSEWFCNGGFNYI